MGRAQNPPQSSSAPPHSPDLTWQTSFQLLAAKQLSMKPLLGHQVRHPHLPTSITLALLHVLLLLLAVPHAQAPTTTATNPPTLNLTAISTTSQGGGGASVLECWAVKAPPASFAAASNYFLGGVANATYTVIPPRTVVGLHNAPFVEFSIVLAGLVHISIPTPNSTLGLWKSKSTPQEVWIQGGRNGLFIAADIPSQSRLGHFAEFPGDAATVLVQVPTADGQVPAHDVLHSGPCGWEEVINI